MLVHSGCVPTVPAIGVPNSSAAEADPSWFDSQLPSWGSSLRLPRRFTGLCTTLASPASSDPLAMPAFYLLGHLIGFPIGAMSARDSRPAEQKLVAELRRIDGVHAQSHEVPRNRMKIGQRLYNSGGDRLPRDAGRERTVWNPLTRHP